MELLTPGDRRLPPRALACLVCFLRRVARTVTVVPSGRANMLLAEGTCAARPSSIDKNSSPMRP